MSLAVGDCKNAFCKSDELKREAGQLYMAPCEGFNLDKKVLLEAIEPVYGFDPAPMRWHRTFTGFIKSMGFRITFLESCLYANYSASGKLMAMILVEVDDLLMAADPLYMPKLGTLLQNRFEFGKWVENETAVTIAGGTFEIRKDHIGVHLEKYIRKELKTGCSERSNVAEV